MNHIFIFRYPRKIEFILLKLFICLCACVSAIWIGKYMIHQLIFNGILKLKLFSKGQGLWIIIFIMLIVSLYLWSLVFNEVVKIQPELHDYYISNKMEIKFKTFTKGVAIMSFISHFTMVLMITDSILQVASLLLCSTLLFVLHTLGTETSRFSRIFPKFAKV